MFFGFSGEKLHVDKGLLSILALQQLLNRNWKQIMLVGSAVTHSIYQVKLTVPSLSKCFL